MRFSILPFVLFVTTAASTAAWSQTASTEKYPTYPSETPASLQTPTAEFDYLRREVMIPMRDGIHLHTVILVPKGAQGAPILLTRTPYDADALTTHEVSAHLAPSLQGYDNATEVIVEGGYIRVIQDVRGKYGSEGDYVMNRPFHGPLNPTPVDHSTDTWDTIDWLVHNTPESNGKVGILGISYDGFLALTALVKPHPALKVAVPMNPMVDGWMGDDWFHNGAFREQNLPYIYDQEATRDGKAKWWTSDLDDYDTYMKAGSAGELGRRHNLEQMGFWRKVLQHPVYDSFWSGQAMDKILADQPLKVPVMLVDSLWDQEDIYGAMAVYKAIKPKDKENDTVFLVIGPWHHGQEIEDSSTLGALHFGTDTGLYFRQQILRPFLDRFLKDDAPKSEIAPVTAFDTGTNVWRSLPSWPPSSVQSDPIYLADDRKLTFTAPTDENQTFDEYVSDPAKPVPYRARPIQPMGYDPGMTWSEWLVDDQREASGRPDVAVYVSDVLSAPLKISGQPIANLMASTTGTDADWVVKVIDVYPDEFASQPGLGGYQLMISADIFRGRYRESLEHAAPITPNQPLLYRYALPTANHVFLPGHRVMVQVQSSWFPLYDRNPQTFVPSIFWAKPADYQKATQRIYHSSFIELPVAKTP
jgi:putative CocE/NonD family hydrolase